MAGKSEKNRKRVAQPARELKREKDRYFKQFLVFVPITAIACVTPFIMTSTGVDFGDNQLIIILPTIVMFVSAMVMSDRFVNYQKAKKRFAEYCRENELGKK
jgi:hypothetical protein